KLPIKYLIFSHFHSDHTLGAGAFLQENPSLIIIAHKKTAEHISLHASEEQKSWGELIKQKSIEARQFANSAGTQEQRNYYLGAANEFDVYYRDIQSSIVVTPNLTFSDSISLIDKDLQVKLIFLGAAHTNGDIVIFIPQDKVLVTGDIVHDFEPLFWDADPESWIRVLEIIKHIDFDYFVGVHGDTHKGKYIIYAWENYIRELKAKTVAAMEEGLTLNEFQNKITTESLTSLQNGYGDRIQKFRTSYIEYLTGPLLDA